MFCGIPFWCNLYQKSFYWIRSFLWSLTISTRTRRRSFVTIEREQGCWFIDFPNLIHFHSSNFVCYFAIKWSIFDLNGRFFDENMIEFNGEHVGMLNFGTQNCLGRIEMFTPLFWGVFTPKIFFVKKILWRRPRHPFQWLILLLYAYIKDVSTGVFNRNWFSVQTTMPEVILFSTF